MTEALSLKERLAERREQLHQERTFVIEIPGYRDLIAGRYRTLPYEAIRKVYKRNEATLDTSEGELNSCADTLILGCVELLEKRDDGEYHSLDIRWPNAADLFGVDLPEGVSDARAVVRAVLPGNELVKHAAEYNEQAEIVLPEVGKALEGESETSVDD